jgi:hypothetical protein
MEILIFLKIKYQKLESKMTDKNLKTKKNSTQMGAVLKIFLFVVLFFRFILNFDL